MASATRSAPRRSRRVARRLGAVVMSCTLALTVLASTVTTAPSLPGWLLLPLEASGMPAHVAATPDDTTADERADVTVSLAAYAAARAEDDAVKSRSDAFTAASRDRRAEPPQKAEPLTALAPRTNSSTHDVPAGDALVTADDGDDAPTTAAEPEQERASGVLSSRLEPEDTATEEPEPTVTPEPEPATPEPTATPEPEPSTTPVPERTEEEPPAGESAPEASAPPTAEPSPTPEPSRTPEPDPSRTPEPEPSRTPEPEPSRTPEPKPEPEPAPEPEPSPSPKPKPEPAPEPSQPPAAGDTATARTTLFQLLNSFRRANGVAPVQQSNHLQNAAQGWADHLARTEPADMGTSHNPRMNQQVGCGVHRNGTWGGCSELIVRNRGGASMAFDTVLRWLHTWWTESPHHEPWMIDERYTHVGHGFAWSDRGVPYAVTVIAERL